MEIIVDKKMPGCYPFWSVIPVSKKYPKSTISSASEDWTQAKLDSCKDLNFIKRHRSSKPGKMITRSNIPNNKSACVEVAKAIESKGYKANVICRWGFYCNPFN